MSANLKGKKLVEIARRRQGDQWVDNLIAEVTNGIDAIAVGLNADPKMIARNYFKDARAFLADPTRKLVSPFTEAEAEEFDRAADAAIVTLVTASGIMD